MALEVGLVHRIYLVNADESTTEALCLLLLGLRPKDYCCLCVVLLLRAREVFCSGASESERDRVGIGERIKSTAGKAQR